MLACLPGTPLIPSPCSSFHCPGWWSFIPLQGSNCLTSPALAPERCSAFGKRVHVNVQWGRAWLLVFEFLRLWIPRRTAHLSLSLLELESLLFSFAFVGQTFLIGGGLLLHLGLLIPSFLGGVSAWALSSLLSSVWLGLCLFSSRLNSGGHTGPGASGTDFCYSGFLISFVFAEASQVCSGLSLTLVPWASCVHAEHFVSVKWMSVYGWGQRLVWSGHGWNLRMQVVQQGSCPEPWRPAS